MTKRAGPMLKCQYGATTALQIPRARSSRGFAILMGECIRMTVAACRLFSKGAAIVLTGDGYIYRVGSWDAPFGYRLRLGPFYWRSSNALANGGMGTT